MGSWTTKDHRTILDDAEDLADLPLGSRWKQWFMGMLLPIAPIFFGAASLSLGRATFFGRDGSMDVTGRASVALNISYIAFGGFLHFHYFWGLSRRLYRFSEAGKFVSLVVLAPCLLYAIWLTFTHAS